MESPSHTVLVVEDDPNDVFLLRRAFKKACPQVTLQACKDGEEAMQYLKGDNAFADRTKFPMPKVLITDLKLPRVSGFDLLRWLRENSSCRVIPTVVLSASSVDEDVQRAYELGANCYFCKPTSFERLVAVVGLLNTFWNEALVPQPPKRCS